VKNDLAAVIHPFLFFSAFSAFLAVHFLFVSMLPQRRKEDKKFLPLTGRRKRPLFPGKQKAKKVAECDKI
jgi:hypothetical protein